MADTLLLDQNAWDLVLDANGNIALASPPYATAQDVASAVRTFLGEVYYDTKQGIPYFEDLLGQLPPASLIVQYLQNQALIVPDVETASLTITSFNARNVSGQLAFTATNGTTTVINF